MQTELRQFITENRFYKATVEAVAGRLPPEDAELDAWLAETVAQSDQKNFMFLLAAAFHRGRRVDARHLVGGAMLLPDAFWLGNAAGRMQGEVAEHLLAAIKSTRLAMDIEATAFLSVAAWCQEHRQGVLPEGMITQARLLARQENLNLPAEALLTALALRVNDAGLMGVIKQRRPHLSAAQRAQTEAAALVFEKTLREHSRKPALELVADKPNNQLASGKTLRRAVARVGRNDPCPCGSGKKYKHCCHEKDQERLHHSSEVAGLTQEELSVTPEWQLTAARLESTAPHLLARFDPAKVPAELLERYFIRLASFNLLDGAVAALERIGYTAALKESWDYVSMFATRQSRRDVVERLVKLRAAADENFKEERDGPQN